MWRVMAAVTPSGPKANECVEGWVFPSSCLPSRRQENCLNYLHLPQAAKKCPYVCWRFIYLFITTSYTNHSSINKSPCLFLGHFSPYWNWQASTNSKDYSGLHVCKSSKKEGQVFSFLLAASLNSSFPLVWEKSYDCASPTLFQQNIPGNWLWTILSAAGRVELTGRKEDLNRWALAMHDLCIIKRSTVFRAITKFQDIFCTFSWHQPAEACTCPGGRRQHWIRSRSANEGLAVSDGVSSLHCPVNVSSIQRSSFAVFLECFPARWLQFSALFSVPCSERWCAPRSSSDITCRPIWWWSEQHDAFPHWS